jgi:hypothetical protein
MTQFIFTVTTELNANVRTATRGVKAENEHEARRQLIGYYLAKKARVISLKLADAAA